MAKAYVIMSNDYPAAVMADGDKAEQYCQDKRVEQKEVLGRTYVNWRCYEFDLDDTSGADSFQQDFLRANRRRA